MINEYGGSFCKCPPKDKHGQTAVMCCNHCGMPDEPFWQPPSPDSEAVDTESPVQHGTALEADCEAGTWTFKMDEPFYIMAGRFKIVPLKK